MSVRMRMTFIALLLLTVTPASALATCYDVAGLPEAASLTLIAGTTTVQGPVPAVGEVQGLCGLGQPDAAMQGSGIFDANGALRLGIKILAARPGCSGAEGEVVLTTQFFSTGTGQIRWPEGSVANVTLTLDQQGHACQPRNPRPGICVGNDTTLCLLQNRFRVVANISTGNQTLPGQARNIGTESGGFSRFGTSNVEVLVKVLDSRALNAFYWVVVTPSTNVGYTVTVTDTQTGRVKTYSSPVTNFPPPVFDTIAFSAVP